MIVTVTATPNAGDPLSIMRPSVTGLTTVTDSLIVTTTGGATFSRVRD